MNFSRFTYCEGCFYLAVVALVYIVLTLIPDSLGSRILIGVVGMLCILGVGVYVETHGERE